MTPIQLKVTGCRSNVPNAEVRRLFLEAAQLRGQTPSELARFVSLTLGWDEIDRRCAGAPPLETSARGVLVLLGVEADRKGVTREVMRAWRAYQIAYLLSLESTTSGASDDASERLVA